MNLEATDASTQQNPEQMDEEFTTTAYPNVQENLKWPSEDPVILEEPASSIRTIGSVNGFGPIHQDTSSVPLMITPVIDLTTSQSGSSLSTSIATTSAVMTTTTISPPPQPQQSSADQTLLQRIGNFKQRMENLLQYNLALEQSDLPTVDMKEILQQQIFKDKSYEAHEDHKKLYDALEKSLERDYSDQLLSDLEEARRKKRKRRDLPRTPSGSPPPPPPPPPPSTDASGAPAGIFGTHELSPMDSLIQDDSILDEQVHLSDDEDSGNDHLPKADLRKDWWKPLPEEERPTTPKPAWTIPFSNVSDVENKWATTLALSISKMKAASYLDFGLELLVPEQMWIDDVYMLLRRVEKKSDQTCGFSVSSELKPTQDIGHLDHLFGSDKRMLFTAVKLWTRNLVIRQRVEDFQLGILEALAYRVKEFKITQLNLVGFNPLVHSFRALSSLRRFGLRMVSAAAKPCQGDSSEVYLITGSIYTDQQGTVFLATLFNESEQRHLCLVITNVYLQESRWLQLLAKNASIHNSMLTLNISIKDIMMAKRPTTQLLQLCCLLS
nr:hypothetical protein [Tanacetum cinerariifolium]